MGLRLKNIYREKKHYTKVVIVNIVDIVLYQGYKDNKDIRIIVLNIKYKCSYNLPYKAIIVAADDVVCTHFTGWYTHQVSLH